MTDHNLLADLARAIWDDPDASFRTDAPAETPDEARRRLASINAAAEYAGVNPRTIRRRVADGSLTGYRMGPRLLRVDLNDLDAMLRPIPTAGGFATAPRERPAPIGGHRYHVQGHDESLRDVRGAADRARKAGATQREVIDFLVLGYRGLVLPGADERRLGAILGAIWADADDQREEAS